MRAGLTIAALLAACAAYTPSEDWEPSAPARNHEPPPPDTVWLRDVQIPDHLERPDPAVEVEIAVAVRDLRSEHFGRASSGARRLVAVGEQAIAYLGYAGKNQPADDGRDETYQIVLRPILREAPARHVGFGLLSPYPDVRVAAAFVCGEQQYTEHVALLVELLEDDALQVRRAAISSLRMLSNRYFGYRADGPPSGRAKSVARWRELWR